MKGRKNALILFDIDGTLIRQVGKSAITANRFAYAVNKTFGTNVASETRSKYGHVDMATLLEMAEKAGIERGKASKKLGRMFYYVTKYFRDHLDQYNTHVHEGVKPFLARLKREGYIVGLVTGNIEPVAEMKLRKLGIYKFFDLGAFGELSDKRSEMIEHAINTANEKFGKQFTKQTTLYFGDTPLDITAAKAAGVRVVAVATGNHSKDILRKEKPDYLLPDMSDQTRIFHIIREVAKRYAQEHRRIVVLGRANTTMTVSVDRMPKAREQVIARNASYAPGGKGSNQAIAAKRLGAKVSFVTCLGRDYFGQKLLAFLRSEGIDTSAIKRTAKTPSGMSVVVIDKYSHNTIISIPGSESELNQRDIKRIRFEPGDIAISQLALSEGVVRSFLAKARAAGATTILNTAPKANFSRSTLGLADYLIANEREAAFFSASANASQDYHTALTHARKIRASQGQTVIVTLGDKGSLTLAGGESIVVRGIKVKALDTQAAGDTFVGAFSTALSQGMGLRSALLFANKAAALCVQKYGAASSIPSRDEVDRMRIEP